MKSEIIFLVQDAPEGGYTARALGESIFTEADTWDELKENIQEAVAVHFDEGDYKSQIKVGITKKIA